MTDRRRGPRSPEVRAKLSAAQKGKKMSPEAKAKISAANKDLDNLWLAHLTCNTGKGARSIGRRDGSRDSRR